MTRDEARFVLRNREMYSDAWVMFAIETLDRAGEWTP